MDKIKLDNNILATKSFLELKMNEAQDKITKQFYKTALNIVEKQIPKQPLSDDNGGYPENYERWLECPVCGEPIPEYIEDSETKCYCLQCAQKLVWEKH